MTTYFPEKLEAVSARLFIDGDFVLSQGGKEFEVVDPSTEQAFGKAVAASQKDVDSAVAAARKAFNTTWKQTDAHEKGKILYKVADLIEQNAEWLAYYESLNNGKPISVSLSEDIPFTAYMYRYFAGQADKIKGDTLQLFHPHVGMTIKEPIGVVGQIIPWNYPLLMMAWKVAPALAAGCTIVLKPAEQTPFTALMLADLFKQAGLPAGVLNVVTGFGETGSFVSTHKDINKISFTGSTEVGYIIMRSAHKENLKPITLELGGKSANIICGDADIDFAVQQACILFGNCGQSCIAGSRTYVHESIYDKVVEGCINYAKGIKVGDPQDKTTVQGAIVSKEQFERILYYIEEGKKEGANCAAGGARWGEKGYFIQPTVFTDVTDNMRIAKEEIFGPVMSILKWSDDEDVIARANALPYGLGAGVVTKSIDKAIKFAKRLQAGTVYVNCYDYTEASTPFGGYKDSGIGKDLGDEGIESYLLTKTIIIKASEC
jgi:aldehyde dehydrogenase (NAD+)